MLKTENLLNQNSLSQTEGVYYGLVDGFAANYSEEQLNIIHEAFSIVGIPSPKEYITNEDLSTITCSNISILSYIDFSNVSDVSDVLDALQGADSIKTKTINSNIRPTAIQYWDQTCNVDVIGTYDIPLAIVYSGMTLLKLKENVYTAANQGGYIITRLDTNKSMQLYQSGIDGLGANFFESADYQTAPEDVRLLTTKDIGKTIPFKIEWSPIIP